MPDFRHVVVSQGPGGIFPQTTAGTLRKKLGNTARKPETPKKSTVVVGKFGCKCVFGAIIFVRGLLSNLT